MTVEDLEGRMGSRELSEWMALLAVEPWGPYRADYHAAQASWASAAPWSKDARLGDFLPRWGEAAEEKELSPGDLRAALLALGAKEVPHG